MKTPIYVLAVLTTAGCFDYAVLDGPAIEASVGCPDLATSDGPANDLAMNDLAMNDLAKPDLAAADLTVLDLAATDGTIKMPDLVNEDGAIDAMPDGPAVDMTKLDLLMPDLVVVPDLSGTCNDGVQNQDETDEDCGGSKCAKCGDSFACNVNADCKSAKCAEHICLPIANAAVVTVSKLGDAENLLCILASNGMQQIYGMPTLNSPTLYQNVKYCFYRVKGGLQYAAGVVGVFNLGDGMGPRMLCPNRGNSAGQIGFNTDPMNPCGP